MDVNKSIDIKVNLNYGFRRDFDKLFQFAYASWYSYERYNYYEGDV